MNDRYCILFILMQGESSGGIENFAGGIFYHIKGSWGGVVLRIQTFFKAKNSFPQMLKIN